MTKFSPYLLMVAVIVAALAPNCSPAQSPPGQAYRPGLGDLMTTTVQPRHIKLALAAQEANWRYAAYELHELQEAFERAAHVWPTWRGVPIADMIKSVTTEPVAALNEAIKSGDAVRFANAYGLLTDACNICHQSANRGMIVIRRPDASSFPDQDFRPAVH